jgi:hypothetical protein
VILVALALAPFGIAAYRSANTTNPYILLAREIEAFSPGDVDVIYVFELPDDVRTLAVVAHIEKYPEWKDKKRENFKRFILQLARDEDYYTSLHIVLGWNYTPETMHIQGIIVCGELKVASCKWEQVNVPLSPEFIKWPGIGKP